MTLPYCGMKLTLTFLHFLDFLHFDEILKTHALLTSLVKISPQRLTIDLKICKQFIVSQFNQMFKFKQMSLLMRCYLWRGIFGTSRTNCSYPGTDYRRQDSNISYLR
jgi:hypothetical protein